MRTVGRWCGLRYMYFYHVIGLMPRQQRRKLSLSSLGAGYYKGRWTRSGTEVVMRMLFYAVSLSQNVYLGRSQHLPRDLDPGCDPTALP